MSEIGTVLIVASGAEEWRPAIDELTQEYGYRALTATSAASAIMVAEEAHIDVVICDHCVGADDGIEVLRSFRVARRLYSNRRHCTRRSGIAPAGHRGDALRIVDALRHDDP